MKSENISKYLSANLSIIEFESKRMNCAKFFVDVDLTEINKIREKNRVSYTTFVVLAASHAAKDYKYVNSRIFSHWFMKKLIHFEDIDIAIAVERLSEGLEAIAYCDIIRNSARLSPQEIQSTLEGFKKTDSSNKQWTQFDKLIKDYPLFLIKMILKLPYYFPYFWKKYRGGAILISSPAKYGVDFISANWLWPIGISFGFAKDRTFVIDKKILSRPSFKLVMSFDRRMLAGSQAAIFFKKLAFYLENPASILEKQIE